MKKYIISLTILLILFNTGRTTVIPQKPGEDNLSWNKRTCTIRGKVIDVKTKEPLPGVNLIIVGTFRGAATGNDGIYEIRNVAPGSYILRVKMMGYEAIEKRITAKTGTILEQNFSLNPSIFEMSEIVITGTGLPELYKDVPVKTNVISRKLIERQKSSNLAEALDFQTGVRVENNCQNCNFTQVRLLGLEGHYSQILIDSNPVVSSLAGVYGLEQFPDEMIERVEIIKGGGSALYGGTAVAGVINLITRRPTRNNITFDYRNASISGDTDQKLGLTLSRVHDSGKSSGYLFATARRRNPYDRNGDGFSELGKLKDEAIGLNWYYKPATNSELSIQLHRIHENRRGGNKFSLPPHLADIAEAIESWRYGGSVSWTHAPTLLFNYKTYLSFARSNRNSYYGAEQDPNAYGTTRNPLIVTGLQSNYRWREHQITAGLQYQYENLNDKAIAYNRIIDATYTDIGFILQDDFEFGENSKSEVVVGSRMDKHSEIHKIIFSPRVVLKWIFSPTFVLRSGFSTGFKPPQVFDEDLHITQVGGEGQIIRNAADLQEERSATLYSGLEFQDFIGKTGIRFSINGFYTRLLHTFLLTERDDPLTDEIEFYRINGKGAKVKGIETESGVRIGDGEISAGMTFQSSKWDEADPDFGSFNIFRTPNMYGNLRFSYDFSRNFNALAVAKYTGPMHVPHFAGYIEENRLEYSKSFLTFDLIASYKIPLSGRLHGEFTVGIYNITDSFQNDFDKGVHRDAGYVYGPLTPRKFLLGFSLGH